MQVALVTCDYDDNIDAVFLFLLLMNRNQEILGHQEIPAIGCGSFDLSRMAPKSKMACNSYFTRSVLVGTQKWFSNYFSREDESA